MEVAMKHFVLALFAATGLAAIAASQALGDASLGDTTTNGSWTLTGSLHDVHVQPMAVTLPNGKVLLAGGLDSRNHEEATAEIFDPGTGRWSQAHAMHIARWSGTMTLLATGKVLVAGGAGSARAEIYDPADGAWTLVGAMSLARFGSTATLLQTGQVLVTGGYSFSATSPTATADLFNPSTGKWTQAPSMSVARENHSAALLQNGDVLVCGGDIDTLQGSDGGAELYHPATNSWALVGRMMTSRAFNSETLLADGSVLVAGGAYGNFSGVNAMAMAERYDPLSGRFFQTGDMKVAPSFVPTIGGRQLHSATLLPDGRVLAAGGSGYVNDFNHFAIFGTSETYNPATGAWSLNANLNVARDQDAAVVLLDGRTLVAGGVAGNFRATATAEIFTPSSSLVGSSGGAAYYSRPVLKRSTRFARYFPSWRQVDQPARSRFVASASRNTFGRKTGSWRLTGSLNVARSGVPMTLLQNGKVLIEGGDVFGTGGVTAELFDPATGKWTMTGSMHVARFLQSAQLLQDGRVLVVGGTN
ncbi:MAG TPA: kelch repeat-containing protein, partial [Candidatus Eremiobacteraceae bacterium]|nr:kelch repeat-containing protein [Candidatus Eremiobacteraceae bacterium]